MKKILILVAVFSLGAHCSYAANNSAGSDSCGLGWEVTQKKSLLSTLVRATTNVFLPPAFSMTSGTSGCDHHSIVKKEDESGVRFAELNYDPLTQEMAQGQGEYLAAFAETLGCSNASSFGKLAQANFKQIVGESNSPMQLYFSAKALGCGV